MAKRKFKNEAERLAYLQVQWWVDTQSKTAPTLTVNYIIKI